MRLLYFQPVEVRGKGREGESIRKGSEKKGGCNAKEVGVASFISI